MNFKRQKFFYLALFVFSMAIIAISGWIKTALLFWPEIISHSDEIITLLTPVQIFGAIGVYLSLRPFIFSAEFKDEWRKEPWGRRHPLLCALFVALLLPALAPEAYRIYAVAEESVSGFFIVAILFVLWLFTYRRMRQKIGKPD